MELNLKFLSIWSKLLYPLAALLTPCLKALIDKNNENNDRKPPCPFSVLLAPFPVIALINVEATAYIFQQVYNFSNIIYIFAMNKVNPISVPRDSLPLNLFFKFI